MLIGLSVRNCTLSQPLRKTALYGIKQLATFTTRIDKSEAESPEEWSSATAAQGQHNLRSFEKPPFAYDVANVYMSNQREFLSASWQQSKQIAEALQYTDRRALIAYLTEKNNLRASKTKHPLCDQSLMNTYIGAATVCTVSFSCWHDFTADGSFSNAVNFAFHGALFSVWIYHAR